MSVLKQRVRSLRFRLIAEADPPRLQVEVDRLRAEASAKEAPKLSAQTKLLPPADPQRRTVVDFVRHHWVEGAWIALITFFVGAWVAGG